MFEDAATVNSARLVHFHDVAFVVTLVISVGVFWALYFSLTNPHTFRAMGSLEVVEFVWTVCPLAVLVALGIPSLSNLYAGEEEGMCTHCVKVVGHQWYWEYELGDDSFTSYMDPSSTQFDVDCPLVLPIRTPVKMLVTSTDVLHSWTLLGAGIKVDAIPGRISGATLNLLRPGVFYGQCSELCGVNHSFMPIVVEAHSWARG